MSQIIFLNRFFYPDLSATSQILADLAFDLARRDECVKVITSRQLYDRVSAQLPSSEEKHGVEIRRVATGSFGRRLLIGRAIESFLFYIAAGAVLFREAQRGDVIVAMTDPPLLPVATAIVARLRNLKLMNWLQDLYPEVAIELGVPALKGPVGQVIEAIRNMSLRRAIGNVVIGEDMAKRLRDIGVAPATIYTQPNWTDDEDITPIEMTALREEWALEDKFVIAYSGNLGRAHDTATFLGAAEQLKNRADLMFLFVGGGYATPQMRAALDERGLVNVVFHPYQPRELLSQSLAVGDVHWLSLKANLDGLILPSKFYGIAAAGRPIIIVGSRTSELAMLVRQYDCGFAVELGDSEGFARAVVTLAEDQLRRHQMGLNARRMLDSCFTKGSALERWRNILKSVTSSNLNAGCQFGGSAKL